MSQTLSDATPQIESAQPPRGGTPDQSLSLSLRRTFAIARNAFREAVRDRVLYNLVLFVLLLIGGAIFLGELSAGQEAKIIVDLSLSAMLLFFVFIIGHFSADLKALSNSANSARFLFRALYYLLPNLTNYSAITAASHGTVPDTTSVLLAIAYAIVYSGVLLATASLIFGRRNFK